MTRRSVLSSSSGAEIIGRARMAPAALSGAMAIAVSGLCEPEHATSSEAPTSKAIRFFMTLPYCPFAGAASSRKPPGSSEAR